MADNRSTRQQIYDRIRESSKQEYILSEMQRLGFWSKNEDSPSLPELLIKKEVALQKELNQLWTEKNRYQNKEAVLKEMRLKRMAAAKQKREETKRRREQQRFEKAEAWRTQKQRQIIYLGEEVSAGLQNNACDEAKLRLAGLPVFASETSLATAAGIDLKELRFLAFSRKVSPVNHYRKFFLPKKTGGKRLIAAPMPRLKKLQHWVLSEILMKIPVHQAANGFVRNRSVASNAIPHLGQEVVVNIDLRDFFPSIHFARVKGVFVKLGYSEKIATILALVCTEAQTEEVVLDGKRYFVQQGKRILPQGSPCSPAITNILCYQLDKRLQGVASKHNYAYTRYADDISFSGNKDALAAEALLWRIKKIVAEEGFTIHPGKIAVMRKGSRQEVTGVVVNEKAGINREKLHRLRAILHQAETKGWANVRWGNGSNIVSAVTGYINYIKMVDPVKGAKFQQQLDKLSKLPGFAEARQQNDQVRPQHPGEQNNAGKDAGGANPDDNNWWKVV